MVSANENKQEILRLIREISFAIEFAMVRCLSFKSTRSWSDVGMKLDVAVSNEGLTLRAVEGIDWLKDHVGESSWFRFHLRSLLISVLLPVKESQDMGKAISTIAHGVARLNKAGKLPIPSLSIARLDIVSLRPAQETRECCRLWFLPR